VTSSQPAVGIRNPLDDPQWDKSISTLPGHSIFHTRAWAKVLNGLPPQQWTFFCAIYDQVLSKDLGVIALAKYEGRPVAGAVFFHFGSHALFRFGASDERWEHLCGNSLVMREAMKLFARQSLSKSDHGKRQCVAGWARKVFRHNRVFKLMPESALRSIGAVFYKHLG
jgi:hypothetical protein